MTIDGGRAPGVWERLKRASIWHPDAIPASEGQASRELKRVVLPAFDVFIAILGVVAITKGMPSFDIVYNDFVSAVAAWGILIAALAAFTGLAFPRLWMLEAAGKLLMVLILSSYATALGILAFQGSDDRAVVALGFTALLVLPAWTLARLGRERRARRAEAEAEAIAMAQTAAILIARSVD